MLCCGAVVRCSSYDAQLTTAPQHIPTQHDMLPQHLVCKYELNCEYRNITLSRNKAPWWWPDKNETCRSVLKCFKSVLCEIICAFVGWQIEVIIINSQHYLQTQWCTCSILHYPKCSITVEIIALACTTIYKQPFVLPPYCGTDTFPRGDSVLIPQ